MTKVKIEWMGSIMEMIGILFAKIPVNSVNPCPGGFSGMELLWPITRVHPSSTFNLSPSAGRKVSMIK